MTGGEGKRNFLLAAAVVVVALILARWLVKAAFMIAFYLVVAAVTVGLAVYLYAKVKQALSRDRR